MQKLSLFSLFLISDIFNFKVFYLKTNKPASFPRHLSCFTISILEEQEVPNFHQGQKAEASLDTQNSEVCFLR